MKTKASFLLMLIALLGCFNVDSYKSDIGSSLQFKSNRIIIPADGKSATPVSLLLQIAVDNGTIVHFYSNRIHFSNDSTEISTTTDVITTPSGPARVASVTLKNAQQLDSTWISAKVNTYRSKDSVQVIFSTAWPDSISVTTSDFVVGTQFSKIITVTGQIFRAVGYPSPNNTISFSAVDSLNNPVGIFSTAKGAVDSTGTFKATFGLPYSSPSNAIRIIGSAHKSGKTTISDTTKVFLH